MVHLIAMVHLRAFRAISTALLVLLMAVFGVTSFANAAIYEQNSDNENNAHTGVADDDVLVHLRDGSPKGPIEFNVDMTGKLPRYCAFLIVRSFDVDPADETHLSLNGFALGSLRSHGNNHWVDTRVEVPISEIQQGKNLVEVTFHTTDTIAVKSAKLLIDEKAPAGCAIASIDAGASTITAQEHSLVADGVTTTRVTLQTFDTAGDPMREGGATVTLSTTLGTLADVTDNDDGTYTATLTSATTAGTAQITGTVDGIDASNVEEVQFVAATDPTNPTDPNNPTDPTNPTDPNNPNNPPVNPTLDSDGDGVPDAVDLDDDNDGISDFLESDGTGKDVDTDGDGVPDRLDLDTDNDTLSDETESGFPALLHVDANNNGLDDAVDVAFTGGSDLNGDGADDAFVPRNTDSDPIQDFRDPDSDNDGLPDADENGDFDNNGIPDYRESRGRLETAIDGGGGAGVVMLSLLSGLVVVRRKRLGKSLAMTLGAVPVALATLPAAAADYQICSKKADFGIHLPSCWYVGAGIGESRLDPDDGISEWDVDDKNDFAYKGVVGYHLLPHIFLEASYADLGDATVKSRNPAVTGKEDVHYKTPAGWVGWLVLDPASRWNIYLKAGTAKLDTDAPHVVNHRQEHNWQLALAGGVQYRFSHRWFARLELDSYDTDARAAFLTVNRYFGEDRERPEPAAPAEPAPAAVAIAAPPPPAALPPPCKKFTGVLDGVHFDTAKAALSPMTKKSLDGVVGSLNEFPKMDVEISAHTDSRGSDAYNMDLSQQRADSVVGYLHEGGIASERVQAKSYGESRPIADNRTAEGQAKNRRVEIKPLNADECVAQ